ncbi:MAG: hypothetical protein II998_10275 [Clostridia bacterium]|nr:hypothetical protein [Clostridia bacterium]
MKKILALVLAVMMVMTLGACSSEEKATKSESKSSGKFVGEWIGVGGDTFGIAMTGEEAGSYTLSVTDDGKASLSIDGEAMELKWSEEGDTIVLKEETLDITNKGNLTNGAIYIEDLMGFGINIYFAQEGTDAADPSLYIPEADRAMLGTWTSYAVTDVLDEDISDVVPADSLTITFNGDYTATVYVNGLNILGQSWSLSEGYGFFVDSDYDISWDVLGEEIKVCYFDENGDSYYYMCKKS